VESPAGVAPGTATEALHTAFCRGAALHMLWKNLLTTLGGREVIVL
jgi:hypothetical protein